MKTAALLLCLAALPAHADLYRWIDPQTGSVKLSSQPPTDPSIDARLVPFRAPAAPRQQSPALQKPKPAAGAFAELEARWSRMLTQLSSATPQDFSRSSQGFQQQLEAYEAVRVELDRLDPAGALRRRNEATTILERLRQGYAAQFGTKPPGQNK